MSFDVGLWKRHFINIIDRAPGEKEDSLREIVEQDVLTRRYTDLVIKYGVVPALPVVYL